MAGLNDPHFDLFTSFGLEFSSDDLLTVTDFLSEQTETFEMFVLFSSFARTSIRFSDDAGCIRKLKYWKMT